MDDPGGLILGHEGFERPRATRIQTGKAFDSADPVVSVSALSDHRNLPVRQSIRNTEVGECLSVEAGQSVARAEPDEPARIRKDVNDTIVRKPVGRRIRPDGQLFGGQPAQQGENQHDPAHNALYDNKATV